MAFEGRQRGRASSIDLRLEAWLEAEREQLPLWLPAGMVAGVAAWFALPGDTAWAGVVLVGVALGVAGLAFGGGRRAPRAAALFALSVALGPRPDERDAGPRLDRPQVATFAAEVLRVEPLPARDAIRLLLRPDPAANLPERVRVTAETTKIPASLRRGARVSLRARLVPPPAAAAPGAYDYAAVAWFQRIGATGRALDPVRALSPPRSASPGEWLVDERTRLSAHIEAALPGAPGGVASALATGDMGGIPQADATAFRRSGLAHLLSVSGLHLTAVVGATMFVVVRLLALAPVLALRLPLPLVGAAAGAVAGVGYTLLTGAEVPTVRSLVAALLVLGALALGREALTLRLVAAGAGLVLLFWPEQAAGASFELSFAAILSIVAFHELAWTRATFERREEPRARALLRVGAELLATGLVVEVALMPIAVFHFHRAGFYGAIANIVAIPLTTFVVMPAEALALLLDLGGLGAPAWWLTGLAIRALLWLARTVGGLPGAVALVPTMGRAAFAAIAAGGLWLALWRTRVRLLGLVPIGIGVALTLAGRPPDLLVTGDGRHVAVRSAAGDVALLRERTGDYVRDALSELGGREGDAALAIDDLPEARCNDDLCRMTLKRGGRTWRLLATRSRYPIDRAAFAPACAAADIVVSDRRLPDWCAPRWLKADAALLRSTGGLAIRLSPPSIETVAETRRGHPWADDQGQPTPPVSP